jgi:outer membrane protein TolC
LPETGAWRPRGRRWRRLVSKRRRRPDFALDGFRLPRDLPVSLPSALARRRPDIPAAEADLDAASAVVGVATAEMYPDITLSAAA